MVVSGASKMVRFSVTFLVGTALTASVPSAMASGERGARGSDSHVSRQAPGIASSNSRNDSSGKHHRIPGSPRRRPARIIVVPAPSYYYSPYFYSPYFVPGAGAVNASFFCLEHAAGFVSRIGLLDHLSGTHKFALEHAAAICPDVDTCIFEGVWPLY
jgi:hypothetical protein